MLDKDVASRVGARTEYSAELASDVSASMQLSPGSGHSGARAMPLAWAPESVRDVLIVASSSRSGSTLLAEMLKRLPHYLHVSGEINPFLRLAGLAWPLSGLDSDALDPRRVSPAALGTFLAGLTHDVGIPDWESPAAFAEERYLRRLHRRLRMQWPQEEIGFHLVADAAAQVVRRLRDGTHDLQSFPVLFHALFLIQLRKRIPAINPYYYDLDRTLLGSLASRIPIPCGPPSPAIVEEPPFVMSVPTRAPTAEDFDRRALVIKTPSNAYRLDFIRNLFPNARCRILHLTRNPAAAINGLYDGWRHWGFHSHHVGEQLCLADYAPAHHGDRGWWKFDLPPGWRNYCSSSLQEVCAFQWRSAHEAIESYVRQTGIEYHRLRFEDLLTGFARDPAALLALREWLGNDDLAQQFSGSLPTTMATSPPRPRRWLQRAEMLSSVLKSPATRACVARLEYDDESWWI